jgi:NAD(P)-dependent dehydrogenase (short-subunit alcohol dehydrogenase family)
LESAVELKGLSAIVTGGAVRIGRAIALRLADEGVNVCIHYGRSAREAEEVVAEVARRGVRGTAVSADLSIPTAAAPRVVDHAARTFGRVDVLVNSAAIFEGQTLADLEEPAWDRHFAINLKSPAFLCREFAARLPEDCRGHIVSIADWRGTRPRPGHLSYTLTKSGIVALTRVLALELAPRIQVNAIAPGAILPPPGRDDAYLQRLAEHIPLRRTGGPDDVADALVFLLRSDFITGEVVHVTGGEEL